jgi:hypothetical protein
MLHPVALPTDLFQVSALCADKPFDHEQGTGVAQKLKQGFLSEKEKQHLYEKEVMQIVPNNPKPLISSSSQLVFENVNNSNYTFEYDNDRLVIKQSKYENLSHYLVIQPNDLILNFYYFPQLDQLMQLIPQAIKLWSEQDVRVTEMKRAVYFASQASYTLQSLTVLREQPIYSFMSVRLDTNYTLISLPPGFDYGDLATNDEFLSTEELKHIFESKGWKPSHLAIFENIQKPIMKNGDWMTQLRVRDNHFRSDHDVFMRVLVPIAEVCNKAFLEQNYKIRSKNDLSSYLNVFTNVFMVERYGVNVIEPDGFLSIGNKFVPVFIYGTDGFYYDGRLKSSVLTLYKPKMHSEDYVVSKLAIQPFHYKDPSTLLYLSLDTEGISVVSFDGTEHLRVTYAKLTDKTLADIIRVITEAA